MLVITNFHADEQTVDAAELSLHGFFQHGSMQDVCCNERIHVQDGGVQIPALSFYWLTE